MVAKRKTGKTRSRRRDYTAEEIAEFRRRDKEFWDKSTNNLEDTERVRAYAERAAQGGVSARIRGYSLRNQMLLDTQATERGFVLTDVDSFQGWQERGYLVERGQSPLYIVAPNRKDRPKDADPAGATAPSEPDDVEDEADGTGEGSADVEAKPPKRKFHMIKKWDIHQVAKQQSDASEDCRECGAAPGEPCRAGCTCSACVDDLDGSDAPAEELWNRLVEDLTKAGYTLDWPAPDATLSGARARVDHERTTVHLALDATADDPAAVADLAALVAEITVRADRAADARRAARATRALTAAPAGQVCH